MIMTSPATRSRQPSKSPRTKPGEQRRRDLLDAGLAVFGRRGVHAATLDEITREAGVAKGTFYLYFSSKEHLLLALQQDFTATMVGRISDAVAAAGEGWAARLDAWIQAMFVDYPTVHAMHDLLYHEVVHIERPPAEPQDEQQRYDIVGSLRQLIVDGTAAGAFQVDDPEVVAVQLFGALHSAFENWHDRKINTERFIAGAQQLFHRAVGLTT
jgi:AcrR family transcriptional regulator